MSLISLSLIIIGAAILTSILLRLFNAQHSPSRFNSNIMYTTTDSHDNGTTVPSSLGHGAHVDPFSFGGADDDRRHHHSWEESGGSWSDHGHHSHDHSSSGWDSGSSDSGSSDSGGGVD